MASLISILTGCAPLQQYRTAYPPYPPAQTGAPTNAIEETPEYVLGFVEFDDHGWLWNSSQMRAVVDRVAREDDTNGLLIVVFAHGWKHNASWSDSNVDTFRAALTGLQKVESGGKTEHPRKIIGVYLGWRGLSQTLWDLKQFTF